MKTYPILSENNLPTAAFEIENAFIAVSTIAQILEHIEGVTEVLVKKTFFKSSDVHVEFKYLGQPHIVWEPFGDSSRYWIGPQDGAEAAGNSTAIEQAFKHHKPPLYRAIIGEVITFRFITRLMSRQKRA